MERIRTLTGSPVTGVGSGGGTRRSSHDRRSAGPEGSDDRSASAWATMVTHCWPPSSEPKMISGTTSAAGADRSKGRAPKATTPLAAVPT